MRILKLLFLTSLVFALSCQEKEINNASDTLALWEWRWEEAKNLTEKHPFLKDGELKTIDRPAGAWIPIFRVVYGEKSRLSDECLIYRVPQEDHPGKLKALNISKEEECREIVLQSSNEIMTKIEDFKVLYERNQLTLNVSGKEKRIDFPHFGKIPDFERFSSSFVKNNLHGAFWLRPKSLGKQQKWQGNFSDNYRDENFHVCHELTEGCDEKVEYHCDQCRYGWYPVVDNVSCGKTMKICGRSFCGEKGMPACPRGEKIMRQNGQDPSDQCFDGSLAGYCEESLQTVCDGDVLICL